MKIMPHALIALSAAVMAVNAQADSFREALQGGKISGELRNAITQSSHTDAWAEAGAVNNNSTGNTALRIDYATAAYKGLSFGVGFQTSWDWGLQDKDTGRAFGGGDGEDDTRNTIHATDMVQGYMNYAFDPASTKTNIRLGRQKIVSPLLMNSGAWPMQDSFDAVVINNQDLPGTSISAIAVNSWNTRFGASADAATSNDKHYDNPVMSLYLTNKSVDGLTVELQWLSNDNDETIGDGPVAVGSKGPYVTTFAGFDYNLGDYTVSAKYLTSDFDEDSNTEGTNVWGVQGKAKVGGVTLQLAHTQVGDDANFPGTLGHVPQFRSYNNTTIDCDLYAGLGTTVVSAAHGLGVEGLMAQASYAMWSQSDEGQAASGTDFDGGYELAIDLQYKVPSVPGLSTRLQLSQMEFGETAGASRGDENALTYGKLGVNYAF
ncbi:hypothetical protein ACQUQU_17685 [Thalassolituus sp. LLYu03]|uniref:hypothetical protein n=1 Tax=Thalassolituus sp. LLYu03 TaxID=3421656 RepID=UPI003D2BD2C5